MNEICSNLITHSDNSQWDWHHCASYKRS